jgi:mono/diheme cytochrome c family protein
VIYRLKRLWWRIRCLFHRGYLIGHMDDGTPVRSKLAPPIGPRPSWLGILFAVAMCLATAPASPPAVVLPVQPAPYAVPAYGATYPDPGDLAAALKELSNEVRLLREALGLRPTEPLGLKAPPPKEVVLTGPALLKANCAACHTGANAKGGAIDFDRPSDAVRLVWADEIVSGRMPKGKALDARKKVALILATQKPLDPPTSGGAIPSK